MGIINKTSLVFTMKSFALAALPAIAAAIDAASFSYLNYLATFNKNYENQEEFAMRVNRYVEVDAFIQEHNETNASYSVGHNQFSDWTAAEYKSILGYKRDELRTPKTPKQFDTSRNASSVNWVDAGAVTPVKNQGQCGSRWSFSTTGALEGAYEIASGNLVSLSEQQFVDCDKVDSGCSGGLMDNGFNFAKSNALCTEESYPYKAKGGTCAAASCTVGLAKGTVTGYKDVSADSESAMMSAVSQQPVSIAIEADKSVFQLYKSGVLQSTRGSSLDHGVLLVGYGTEDGTDYWKVKNSWGASWGDAGYVKLLRGKGGSGECGLLKQASYPVVSS